MFLERGRLFSFKIYSISDLIQLSKMSQEKVAENTVEPTNTEVDTVEPTDTENIEKKPTKEEFEELLNDGRKAFLVQNYSDAAEKLSQAAVLS